MSCRVSQRVATCHRYQEVTDIRILMGSGLHTDAESSSIEGPFCHCHQRLEQVSPFLMEAFAPVYASSVEANSFSSIGLMSSKLCLEADVCYMQHESRFDL